MSTNFFIDIEHEEKRNESLHFGKSSAGWYFSVRVYPDLGIVDLDSWKAYLEGKKYKIWDEYETSLSWEALLKKVTSESFPALPKLADKEGFEQGNFNLWRHKVDGSTVLGHGISWSYINVEFR